MFAGIGISAIPSTIEEVSNWTVRSKQRNNKQEISTKRVASILRREIIRTDMRFHRKMIATAAGSGTMIMTSVTHLIQPP